MSSSEELIELVKKLKRERSFVYAEQKHIREQYAQVIKKIVFSLYEDSINFIFHSFLN
jgi:hypothetical protein